MKNGRKDFSQALLAWYYAGRRDLPWRPALRAKPGARPDAYHVLLSEFMLQQTQVSTVIPYFHRFLGRFPTLRRLAEADLQEVLQLWQGLGYYSRARNLHAAARMIQEQFAGEIPAEVTSLQALPWVGRYTAGAISSIAFNRPAPILDGNVQRVLCRLDAITQNPRERTVQQQLWQRAQKILPKENPGDFNSALMELGALVCTPRNPQCASCPLQPICLAQKRSLVDVIPPAKKALTRPLEQRWVFCLEHQQRWLLEKRPETGRWAGLWQFFTLPAGKGEPTCEQLGKLCQMPVRDLQKLGEVMHQLTHRRYQFTAWHVVVEQVKTTGERSWVQLEDLGRYPLSKPQLEIARLCRSLHLR